PSWFFPTARTDFAYIQRNLDGLLERAEQASTMPRHSEQYNMAMNDMHQSIEVIKLSLLEAVPYMYVSPTNIAMASLWIAAIIAIFAVVKRAKPKVQLTVRGQIP
ncbi:MAG TPA: glycosyl transferase, partial [Nitrososphaera sp.]|nr:glycosyl transferase [Nitrososphaera sp.]